MKPVLPAAHPTPGPQGFCNSTPRKGDNLSSGRDEFTGDEPRDPTHIKISPKGAFGRVLMAHESNGSLRRCLGVMEEQHKSHRTFNGRSLTKRLDENALSKFSSKPRHKTNNW